MGSEVTQYSHARASRTSHSPRLALRRTVTVATIAGVAIMTAAPAVAAAAPSPEYGLVDGGTVVTVDAPPAIEYVQVDAGVPFSVALSNLGAAYTWGDNWFGQLGTGEAGGQSRVPVPVVMPDGVTFTQVSAGADHVLALGSDGNVYAWGDNGLGGLGVGSTAPEENPTPVQTILPPDATITAVAAGGYHSFALATDGRLFAWGNNSHGQLGLGTSGGSVATPAVVAAPPGVTFTSVSVGLFHTLAISQDGTAYAWGRNNYGQLGLGDNADQTSPVAVAGPLATSAVTHLVAGHWHSMAIAEDGTAFAWGDNLYGQLGDGTLTHHALPVSIAPPVADTQFTDLAASGSFSVGTGSDGATYAWGDNYFGQLGIGATGASSLTPIEVHVPAGAAPFKLLSAAEDHAFARGADGIVYGWGFNGSGRLGIGSAPSTAEPQPILLPELEVTAVQFGGVPAMGVTDNGDGTLQVITPAHAAGTVDITVHWSLAGVPQALVTYVDGFTYATEPTITVSPLAQQAKEGDNAVFTATVDGFPSPELTWHLSTDAGATWAPVTSGTSSDGTTLTVRADLGADGNLYRALARNVMGSATSEAVALTVTEVPEVTDPPEEDSTPPEHTEPVEEESLPATGLSNQGVVLTVALGSALLLFGLALLVDARRRRETRI